MLSWSLGAFRELLEGLQRLPQRGSRRIPGGGKWQRHLSDLENPGPCKLRSPQGLEAAQGLEWSPSVFGICHPPRGGVQPALLG